MSDAEAGLIPGQISSIITVIDTISKVYSDVKDPENIPLSFQDTARRLPLIHNTLGVINTHIIGHSPDEESYKEITSVVSKCKDKAFRLEIMFRKVVPQTNTPRLERYGLAVRVFGEGNRVEALTKGILEDIKLLAGNQAVKAATEVEVGKLDKAIEELAAMRPSLPGGTPKNSVNNYGPGTQNANTGDGTQNNNTGPGKLFVGEKQYFGED
jgi:hypothetical protein